MITIYFQPLPFTDVKACVSKHKANYTVLVNTNNDFSIKEIAHSIRHEMNHIRMNHFDSDRPLEDIEKEADQGYDYGV